MINKSLFISSGFICCVFSHPYNLKVSRGEQNEEEGNKDLTDLGSSN